ncbi:metallophosphoesterase [Cognatilysobacter bugurensis]|uniref:Metallophosphatase n=1 Tax=Cognatilysobacter bugurensis TaxID=543356 RepID=A0A918W6P1_9GAMM|nr:metallophosphoesterase [Lysobacter bugurensis]GHA78818.1 metallophosphatase [Lysobacter bugurensis]
MFSIILYVVGSLMHFYVADRVRRAAFLRERVRPGPWWLGAVLVWLVYIAGVRIGDEALDWRWWPGQFAMTWLGLLFVMTMCLLVADVLTGFGLWLRRHRPALIGIAAMAGLAIGAFGIWQAVRAPRVIEYEVMLDELPRALDGTVLAMVADLHLGAQRGPEWLAARVEQINALSPDAVVMVGDQVEGEPVRSELLPAVLQRLQAPLGVWAVTGNHEFYGDVAETLAEFEAGGVGWLRDGHATIAPGLVLTGIDDVGRAMRRGDDPARAVEPVLATRPDGASILLAHIPALPVVEQASRQGVDLMLSGHTHDGQIWPFNHAVKTRFPLVVGEYRVGAMTLIVSRGAGSWGPRMRLWKAGEIVKLTLRSPRP